MSDKPRLLYLITHAQTIQDRSSDATQWSLSPLGKQQAVELAAASFWSSVDTIVLSTEAKTLATVDVVLRSRSLPLRRDAHFDELRRGREWVGDYVARGDRGFQPADARRGWMGSGSRRTEPLLPRYRSTAQGR
ncbi:MAG: histidine phosphatase family protein [Caldilineaceae bacterium]|nr:histidine phosphatase family protein [Caldilineaceae bacterium]